MVENEMGLHVPLLTVRHQSPTRASTQIPPLFSFTTTTATVKVLGSPLHWKTSETRENSVSTQHLSGKHRGMTRSDQAAEHGADVRSRFLYGFLA
jgi:hypothetical protein